MILVLKEGSRVAHKKVHYWGAEKGREVTRMKINGDESIELLYD